MHLCTAWANIGKAADKMCSADKLSFSSSAVTLFPRLCPWACPSFLSLQSQTLPTYKALTVYFKFNFSIRLCILNID